MSRRSITVLVLLLVSVLGLFVLTRLATHETRVLEPVAPAAPAPRQERRESDTPLVGAARDDRSTTGANDQTAIASVAVGGEVPALEETPDAPQKPISLRVHLVDERGHKIARGSAGVSAWTEDGIEWSSQTSEPGLHIFRGLPPGSWRIVAAGIGYREAEREVFVARPDAALDVEIVLVALPSVRIVLLTSDGEPYSLRSSPHPDAIATRDKPGDVIREELDRAGRFPCCVLVRAEDAGLDNRHLGLLVLTCDLPLWVSLTAGGHVIESQRLDRGIDELIFRLDRSAFEALLATVRLRVVDAVTRMPVANAIAELKCGPRHSVVSISKEGVVEFPSVLPGIARLRILQSEYEYTPTELLVPPGAQLDLGDVAVSPVGGGELRVKCEVPDGITSITTIHGRSADVLEDGQLSSYVESNSLANEPVVMRLSHGEWRVLCKAEREGQRFRSRPMDVTMNGDTLEITTRLELVAELVLMPAASARRVMITDVTERRGSTSVHEVGSRAVTLDLPVGRFEVVVHGPGEEESRVTVDLGPNGARVDLE